MIVRNKSKINFGLKISDGIKRDAIKGSKNLAEKKQVINQIKTLSNALEDNFSLTHRFGKADGSDVFESEMRLSQQDQIMDAPLLHDRVATDEYVNYGMFGGTLSEELQYVTVRKNFMCIQVDKLQALAKELASGEFLPF